LSFNYNFRDTFTEDVRTKRLKHLNKLNRKGTLPDRSTPSSIEQQSSKDVMTIGSITHTTTATSSAVSAVADTFHLSASSIAGPANGRQVDQFQQGS